MLEIGHHPHWHAGSIAFNADTVISMLLVSFFLAISAILINLFVLKKNAKNISAGQAAVEIGYEFIQSLPVDVMGKKGYKYVPFIATLFFFILFSNLFGLIPVNAFYSLLFEKTLGVIPELPAPTADINTTTGLALIVFFSVHYFGTLEKGVKYFLKFFQPNFLFLPLNIMEEAAKPLSLAIRLFGNTFGKETIILVLISLTVFPILYPLPLLALGLFIAFVQAYIFPLLTTFYIAAALEGH